MEFDAKKESVLRYMFLSEKDKDIVIKSLPPHSIEKLNAAIAELEEVGIRQENLWKFDYATLLKAVKTDGPNDAYQKLLRIIENKSASLGKESPKKLVGAINSMLI